MTQGIPNIYNEITSRLKAVRKKENIADLINGALLSAFVLIGLLLIALLLEGALYLGTAARTIIFYLFLLLASGLISWLVVLPLLRLFNILPNEGDLSTAHKVGLKYPLVRDHLENILQLFHERDHTHFYSVELIDASFEDVRKEMEALDFDSVVDYSRSRRMSKFLGVAAGVGILFFVLLPGSAYRLLKYNQSFADPAPFLFVVEPGDQEVVKGQTVPMIVRVEGKPPDQVVLSSKPAGQIEFDEKWLARRVDGTFRHEFSELKATTSYFVSSGSIRSDEFTLRVIDRPIVKVLGIELTFPSYTRLSVKYLDENIGDVAALKGTRVAFSLETNKDLSDAKLVFNDKSEVPLKVNGTKASGGLELTKEATYRIFLQDLDGVTNADPIEYTLKIIPDAYPTARIELPGVDMDIAGNEQLNMLFRITDDYGFTRLRLAHRLVQSRYEKPADEFTFMNIPLPDHTRGEALVAHLWSLGSLSLVPEDVLKYYIEVFDNDNISGPKSARSEVYTLRLPSLDEVFSDLDKGHEVSLEKMNQALENAREAKKELDELHQEISKDQKKIDWQEQKRAEALLQKYEGVQKKIDEVNKTVERMLNEMEKHQLLSRETLEKYSELQQLMEQMNSTEFAEAMKKMQQALQQMNPEAMRKALQQFNFSEETFRKGIERTINLLKRIQIEQKVDEVLKRAEEMLKQQNELQNKTAQTNPQDTNELAKLAEEQKHLKDQLDQLQRELAELQKKMEEFPDEMPLSEIEEAMKSLEQSQLAQQMDQITQELQRQQVQQALQNQQQAAQKMSRFMHQLQQMQQALQENQQREIVNEMRKALQDLLELSKRQENLRNVSQGLEQNSQRFRQEAQDQMEAMRDLGKIIDRLSKLSQKTFGITPGMGKSIGDAMREMNNAMQSLERRNGRAAEQQQSIAMGSLNEAAQQVQSAMNAMMQGGGQGVGMAGLMQRLQGLTGMQQGINEGTQNLGGMSPQQAAEFARLAGEQGMVRKSLEQLAKEATNTGALSKLLGDLNRIAQDMKEVQTDLAQGNVNPETLHKQERILSRLLDSQRSIRERDYEKRRRAEVGKDVTRRTPAELDLTTQEGKNRLRQDMLKAMEEGYARDYEELIKKYFEALEQYEKQN